MTRRKRDAIAADRARMGFDIVAAKKKPADESGLETIFFGGE
jgi:hypothetical protein